MKKYINIITTLILLILVTGCSNSIEKNEKGGDYSTNKPSVSTNNDESSTPVPSLSYFLGEWNTTKRLIIPRVYSEKELQRYDMVGHKVIIKPDLFSDEKSHINPYYKVSEITSDEFIGENTSDFIYGDLIKLNIYKKSNITKLDVFSDRSSKFLIETFYLEDENTLITNSNYDAIFELKRIK